MKRGRDNKRYLNAARWARRYHRDTGLPMSMCRLAGKARARFLRAQDKVRCPICGGPLEYDCDGGEYSMSEWVYCERCDWDTKPTGRYEAIGNPRIIDINFWPCDPDGKEWTPEARKRAALDAIGEYEGLWRIARGSPYHSRKQAKKKRISGVVYPRFQMGI